MSKFKPSQKRLFIQIPALKRILRENDSLKRKEYYQKRYNDSISLVNQFSTDSSKYYRVARQYNDFFVIAAIGSYPTNFILENGTVNKTLFACLPENLSVWQNVE